MCEFSQHDKEDNEAWDPRIHLIDVHSLVSEQGDNKSARCDDNDACVSWYILIDCVQKLGSNNGIDA